jgi:hypothetical protein
MRGARGISFGVAVALFLLVAASTASGAAGGPYVAWNFRDAGGSLGDGGDGHIPSPELINLAPGVSPTAISESHNSAEAIGSDGQLYTWGLFPGDGTSNDEATPHELGLPGGVLPVAISAGAGEFDSVIGTDHRLYSWGDANFGNIGDGREEGVQLTPKVIPIAAGVSAVAISNGVEAALAIGSDGRVYGWGSNGAFGPGPFHYTPTLIEVNHGSEEFPSLEPFSATKVSSGCNYASAIGSDGHLYTWGDEDQGELGNGIETGSEKYPKAITLEGEETATAVSSGCTVASAISSTGKLYYWGEDQLTPKRIALPAGVTAQAIASGIDYGLVLGANHNLYEWQVNSSLEVEGVEHVVLPSGVTPTAVAAGILNDDVFVLDVPGASLPAGGTLKLKTTKLIGNTEDKISGTGWTHDTSVRYYECSTTYYTTSSCSQLPPSTDQTLSKAAFKNHVVKLLVGPVGGHENPCGLAGGVTCDLVVVGNSEDETASAPLSFKVPTATVKLSEEVPSGYVEKIKAANFPAGETVTASECDAEANSSNLGSHCGKPISATAGKSGKPKFAEGLKILTGAGYEETGGGTGKCEPGGTCAIAVYDAGKPSTAVIIPIKLA